MRPRDPRLGILVGAVGAMFASACASIYYAPHLSRLLSDFYGNVWWPGKRIYYGAAGFPDLQTQWPATATATLSPFALLPEWAAVALWLTASIASFGGALWLLGCRDALAYAVAFASPPVLCCLVLGNMTLMLVAGIGGVWVARDRHPVLAGSIAGAMVVMKVVALARRSVLPVDQEVRCGVHRDGMGRSRDSRVVASQPRDAFGVRRPDTKQQSTRSDGCGMGVLSIAVNEGASVRTGEVAAFTAGIAALVVAWRATGDLSSVHALSRRGASRVADRMGSLLRDSLRADRARVAEALRVVVCSVPDDRGAAVADCSLGVHRCERRLVGCTRDRQPQCRQSDRCPKRSMDH